MAFFAGKGKKTYLHNQVRVFKNTQRNTSMWAQIYEFPNQGK